MNYGHVGENRVQKYVAVIKKRSFEFGRVEKTVIHRDIRDFQNAVTFSFEELERNFISFPKPLDFSYRHVKFQNDVIYKHF